MVPNRATHHIFSQIVLGRFTVIKTRSSCPNSKYFIFKESLTQKSINIILPTELPTNSVRLGLDEFLSLHNYVITQNLYFNFTKKIHTLFLVDWLPWVNAGCFCDRRRFWAHKNWCPNFDELAKKITKPQFTITVSIHFTVTSEPTLYLHSPISTYLIH